MAKKGEGVLYTKKGNNPDTGRIIEKDGKKYIINKHGKAKKMGRPADPLKGTTPQAYRIVLNKLKDVTPKAIDSLVQYFNEAEGVDKARAAKDLITLYVTVDKTAIQRAKEAYNLIKQIEADSEAGTIVPGTEPIEQDSASVFTLEVVS